MVRSKSSNSPAQTVGRAIDLLKLIASSHVQRWRLIDIAAAAGLDKSTTHRLLQRLVRERMLVRDAARGYRLGPLLYELGLVALPETNLREVSQVALLELARVTGDVVFLVVRSGLETVCVNRIAGNFPIQTMTRTEGDRHPLGVGAGGLAVLASLADDDIQIALDALAPRLSAYQLTRKGLLQAVADTRARNAIAVDAGSAALDVTALGQAILNTKQAPVAAIFVASISHRMTDNRRELVCKELTKCVKSVEQMMRGGQTAAPRTSPSFNRSLS